MFVFNDCLKLKTLKFTELQALAFAFINFGLSYFF